MASSFLSTVTPLSGAGIDKKRARPVDGTISRMTTTYDFDSATAIEGTGDLWHGRIAEGWDMGGVPNGGYQLAIAARAILAASGRRNVISLMSTFLSPGVPGDVDIEVKVMPSRGRRHTSSVATIRQGGLPITLVQATTGELPENPEQHLWEAAPPHLDEPDTYPMLEPADPPARLPPPIARHVELRLPPEQTGFAFGRAHGAPTVAGWVRFPDNRPLDTLAVPLFLDSFPPAVFNTGRPSAWVPTIALSVQVRGRPKGPWLAASFTSRVVDDIYLDEDGELWNEDGSLVALSRQLALAPRGG